MSDRSADAGRWYERAARGVARFGGKLAGVLPQAVDRYFADRCPQHAAGIAYRVLFSIVPLSIVLISVFGLVLQDDDVREYVVDTIVDALPVSESGQKDVEDAIGTIATPASTAGLVSLLVFGWAATGMMAAIRGGLESAMHVRESRPVAHGKLVDLVLVVGAAALVLVTAGFTLLGDVVHRAWGRLAEATGLDGSAFPDLVSRGTAFLVTILVVILLYRFVPSRGLRPRDGLVGAVVTSVLLQLISLASGWIYDSTLRLSFVYGSLTAALVFVYSIYLYSSALLLGAEVAAAWARSAPPSDLPLLAQVKRAALGLFVRQEPLPEPTDERRARESGND